MRNLTIQRGKCFPGCLAPAHVYIEDADAGELLINGVPCRKLGTLKNGQSGTYPISQRAAKVFVITDKASRNYANDYYPLPEGDMDVTLTGRYELGSGGAAFRFDGVTDEAALANRKKGGRKGMLVLIVALILGSFLGTFLGRSMFRAESNDPKTFSGEGIHITLTEAFDESTFEGFTLCYEARNAAVFILKEPFTLMAGLEDYTLDDYGALVVQANRKDPDSLRTENGVTYFDYTFTSEDGSTYYYFSTVHKSGDAFWLVQFAILEEDLPAMQDELFQWAKSITFD